jgi:hypothetical protein
MMLRCSTFLVVVTLSPWIASAQTYQVEVLKEGPPASLAATVREVLQPQGYRILADDQPFVDYWLRKSVPATAKPSGPKGSVIYPELAEGELVGAARYASEAGDFRDQVIAPGVYTLRYGQRLDDGNHANVSPYMDYVLLLPASRDTELAPIKGDDLHKTSSIAAGTTHPAILNLALPSVTTASSSHPTLTHDEMEDFWGLVVPLSLTVPGESVPASVVLQLIFHGASAG